MTPDEKAEYVPLDLDAIEQRFPSGCVPIYFADLIDEVRLLREVVAEKDRQIGEWQAQVIEALELVLTDCVSDAGSDDPQFYPPTTGTLLKLSAALAAMKGTP